MILIRVCRTGIIMQVSYGAPDTIFNSNRDRFPYFHRTLPSNAAVNIGTLRLMKEMNWRRAGLLSSADSSNGRVRISYCCTVALYNLKKTMKMIELAKTSATAIPRGIGKVHGSQVFVNLGNLLCMISFLALM